MLAQRHYVEVRREGAFSNRAASALISIGERERAMEMNDAAGKPSFEELTRSSLFPLALQDEGGPIIWLSPLFLFPDRQLSLT